MSFNNATITWSANQVTKMIQNDSIIFTNIIQRPYVWKKTDQSYFIDSVIRGVPIQRVYAKKFKDDSKNIYDVLDGKQRLTTLKRYINNEFALSELKPVEYYNEFTGKEESMDISGLKFYELPEVLQEKIKSVSITVAYFENLTKEEEKELFKRLNAGMVLSTKSRALASTKDLDNLLEIGEHKLFNEMLNDKAKEARNQVSLTMKAWCMLNQNINNVTFESKKFNALLEETEVSNKEKQELINVFDMIVKMYSLLNDRNEKKVSKKLYTELHMISLVPFFRQAVESNINLESLADWLVCFYGVENGLSKSNIYNESCKGGTAKNNAIFARHSELLLSYNEFFKQN